MTEYITIKLTQDQYNTVLRSVENNFMDYSELYPDYKNASDNMAKKHNAYLTRLLKKLLTQVTYSKS